MKTITGYHFTGATLRNGDPIPPIGKWLRYEGAVVPCTSGLHCSEHPFDALQYAPGDLLHRVELRGDLQSHGHPIDKWVGRERRILASINAESMLRSFARAIALSVMHLWNAPEVVVRYLRTGDETIRTAAYAAANAAAYAAAAAATYTATTAAANAATYTATTAATYTATTAATYTATTAAANAATYTATTAAANAATYAAAYAAARKRFLEMVNAEFEKGMK